MFKQEAEYEIAVRVLSARNLRILQGSSGDYSPYVKLTIGSNSETYCTRVDEHGGRNPCWNEKFIAPVVNPNDVIQVQIVDQSRSNSNNSEDNESATLLIGESVVPMRQFCCGQLVTGWYPLSSKTGACGEINLRIQMAPCNKKNDSSMGLGSPEVESLPTSAVSPVHRVSSALAPELPTISPSPFISALAKAGESAAARELSLSSPVIEMSPAPLEYHTGQRRRSANGDADEENEVRESILRSKRPCTSMQTLHLHAPMASGGDGSLMQENKFLL